MKRIINCFGLLLCFLLVSLSCRADSETARPHNSAGPSGRAAEAVMQHSTQAAAGNQMDKRVPALEQMAEQDPRAAYDLALRYFRGDGVDQNTYKAIQWMRKSAEKGYLDAQKALGRIYLTGLEEMGADPQEAERWLTIAANRGDRESAQLLEQARAARKKETDYFRWKNEQRELYYNSWYSDYPYRGSWRNGRWYY